MDKEEWKEFCDGKMTITNKEFFSTILWASIPLAGFIGLVWMWLELRLSSFDKVKEKYGIKFK